MGVLAKMVLAERTENWGSHFPPEHYENDHWFTSMAEGKGQTCECVRVETGVSQVSVKFIPVYDKTPGHENHKFWDATPSGELRLTISNPDAFDQLQVGEEYYVEIRRARK